MKKIYISILVTSVIIFGLSYWYRGDTQQESGFMIRDFIYDKDHQKVDDLFHKHDNWYWMISTAGTNTYSIDFTLKYATSSQHAKKYDSIMKVATVDGKIAGFLLYHPESAKVWRLLFLIVDQDFRRQGIAKKLLQYAVDDMVKHGAIRIDIATRNNNFRAQNLYKNFGAKLVDNNDNDFVHFSWYRQNS
jgi:ribosomal protein S18 acetylase RimI-like enzyme